MTATILCDGDTAILCLYAVCMDWMCRCDVVYKQDVATQKRYTYGSRPDTAVAGSSLVGAGLRVTGCRGPWTESNAQLRQLIGFAFLEATGQSGLVLVAVTEI